MCLALGRNPLEITAQELGFWQRFFESEPLPEDRADMRMARQVWATFQPHSKRKLDENKYRLVFNKPRRLTPAEYKAKSMRAYSGHGGKLKRK